MEVTNNVRIIVRRIYIKPQDLPAATVNCSVNGEIKRFQFIITVYMSHEIWSLRHKPSSFKFLSFSLFEFLTIMSKFLMNTAIAKI